MKKSLLLGSKLLLMALLLAACSTKAPSTSPSSTTTEEVTQQQFEAGNGTFSVNLKGDWEAVDYLPGFDLEISSLDQTREIQLNQYAKVDLFLTVAEMAEKNFIAADGITVLSETSPLETSIAGKKGYLKKVILESEGNIAITSSLPMKIKTSIKRFRLAIGKMKSQRNSPRRQKKKEKCLSLNW